MKKKDNTKFLWYKCRNCGDEFYVEFHLQYDIDRTILG